MTSKPAPPLLVFGWGNLSRGDDALGPLCVEQLRAACETNSAVEFLDDYQLQVEHALDLVGRSRILFVDASLSPQALMQIFVDLQGTAPPPCTLLAIRGEGFELGEPPSALALENLKAATQWAQTWIQQS